MKISTGLNKVMLKNENVKVGGIQYSMENCLSLHKYSPPLL